MASLQHIDTYPKRQAYAKQGSPHNITFGGGGGGLINQNYQQAWIGLPSTALVRRCAHAALKFY